MSLPAQRLLFLSLFILLLVFFSALIIGPHHLWITIGQVSNPPGPSQTPSSEQQKPHNALWKQDPDPEWLIATISAYQSQQRRNIIRATWQTLYENPAYTTRFVIAQPSPLWAPAIQHENATYGDLIILETLSEDSKTANTIKTVEFLKLLTVQSEPPPLKAPWKFVSKLDDDSYLSAQEFHTEFLLPRLLQNSDSNNSTLIARRLTRPDRPFPYPGGQFYTLSFDLVRLVASTHSQNPIHDLPEDVLIGRLLYDAGAEYDFVELDDTRAFDVSAELRVLSKEGKDLGEMGRGAINPHKMKGDEMYLRVASMFGEDGFVDGG